MQPNDAVRQLVLDLWTQTRMDWGFASDRIAQAFRRERQLGSRERRWVAETLYGMIRQARRVDFALEGASTRALGGRARELARFLAFRVLAGEVTPEKAAAELAGVDFGAVLRVDERIAREPSAVGRLALSRSLPDWLAGRLCAEYGDEADALADALNQRAPLTVRANAVKIAREDLQARLAVEGIQSRPTKLSQHGLVLETRVNVFGLSAFKEGLFEAQDEASQLVAELCAPTPKSIVVDACAGAGGKTLALAALMASKGRVLALDIGSRKLEELRRRARRAGLSNVRAVEISPSEYPDEILALRGKADRVLVDAPCSGLGALRRNPEARWRLSGEDLLRLPPEQEAILRRAATLVASGGRLIYATCTVLEAENEDVVGRLCATEPWEVVPMADVLGDRASLLGPKSGPFLKTLPHRHDTDGFFAAVLRRR